MIKFCPNCGFKLAGGEAFCPNCGMKLAQAPAPVKSEPEIIATPVPVVTAMPLPKKKKRKWRVAGIILGVVICLEGVAIGIYAWLPEKMGGNFSTQLTDDITYSLSFQDNTVKETFTGLGSNVSPYKITGDTLEIQYSMLAGKSLSGTLAKNRKTFIIKFPKSITEETNKKSAKFSLTETSGN